MKLNKTDFVKFTECPNEFWLNHHFPEPAGEISIDHANRREVGYEVERLARTLPVFKNSDGILVEFGKVFETAELYAKADIVVTDIATDEVEIYEVKSSTKVKVEHELDLAFQCIVAENCGKTVKGAYIITVDSSYVYDGNLDAEKLLRVTDETEKVLELKDEVAAQIIDAIAFRDGSEPVVKLIDYCKGNKLECRYLVEKFPDIPSFNVSHIFNSGSKKLNFLLENGIASIADIPGDFKMTDREAKIVAVERSGESVIDLETILGELEGLTYPLNFLDYESFSTAVPKFEKTYAYQQVPFQYSLHTLDEPNGELKHSYHLARNDGRHPSEEIAEKLYEDLSGNIGTVIVWSQGFETKLNKEMGETYPQFAEFFTELNESVYDLRTVFSRRLYMHPEFCGKDSIKKVMPVLCPHLSYDELDIGDGMTASIKWYHMAFGRGTEAERSDTYQNLLKYCELDTFAMVEIFRVLLAMRDEGSRNISDS